VPAGALPTGGTVVHGDATINQSGTQLDINQSTQKGIINWQSFSIGADAHVRFNQPDASSITLNRVTGGDPSHILGQLTANGQVMLINQNGILFGAGAKIDVAGLVATTSDISDSNFINGNYNFAAMPNAAGAVVNEGEITIRDGGLAALVAPTVRNSGTIVAKLGRVALAAGETFTLDFYGDQLVQFAVPASAGTVSIENSGKIHTDGGKVLLSAATAKGVVDGVINMDGIVEARSVGVKNGVIVLDGGEAGTVNVAGTLDASDSVTLNAQTVNLNAAITLDALATLSGNATEVNVGSGGLIQNGVDVAAAGATVNVAAGTYAEAVTVNKQGLTISGAEGAKLAVAEGQTGFTIAANDVTVEGMEIVGPNDATYTAIDWDATPNSFGVWVNPNVTNVTIRDNTIRDVRTGIYVNNGVSGTITGNVIDNTKGGVLVRQDGSTVTITGNREDAVGNEWGIVYNLGNVEKLGEEADATRQAFLLDTSGDNDGMSVLDRGYSKSNRTHVFVDDDSTATDADDFGFGNGLGNANQALKTIAQGIDAVVAGGTVTVRAGTYTMRASPSTRR